MPQFHYKAKEGPHKVIDGTIDADTLDQAIAQIIKRGATPIDVSVAVQKAKAPSKKNIGKTSVNVFKKIKLSDLTVFTRQMCDLVEASVPILRALQIALRQTPNPRLKEVINQMHNAVKDGSSFSEALAKHPDIFSSLYVNMTRTGELSGNLDVVLSRLADYLEKEQDTRQKVRSSLAYPLFILVVGFVTIFVLMSFVIPRLSVMFEDLNQDLPLPTVILTSVSNIFAKFWWLMLGVMALVFLNVRRWVQTPQGQLRFDEFKLKIPLLGEFIKTVEIGRFARTLGTLTENGVTITSALKSVAATMDNVILRNEIKRVAEEVNNGASLRKALSQSKIFPEMAVNMIAVGEEIGKLEKGLYKIAETYERQSDETVKAILSLLGPVVLVVIVSIVGFVVIALMLPIFKMNLLIQ